MNAVIDINNSPIAREVADDLLARLEWMTIKPAIVLSIGCDAEVNARLQARFEEAQIVSSSFRGLSAESSVVNEHWLKATTLDSADKPRNDSGFDVIFANLALPMQADYHQALNHWRRLLKPDGLLMLSTLGVDTLKECRTDVLPTFVDLHDIGDALIAADFADPVIDVDYLTTVYRDKQKLITELRASGMVRDDVSMLNALTLTNELAYELTYEIIFAHAFAPQQARNVKSDGEVKIPLSALKRTMM